MNRTKPGIALLESIVALTILAVGGAAVAAMAAELIRTVNIAREAEEELRAANAFMEAVVLWTRDDLNRRLGEREQGAWRLKVERPISTLYTIELVDSLSQRTLLRTAVFRPEPRHAAPSR